MPAAIAIPLITGAVTAGAAVYGANKQAGANDRATAAQAASANQALQFEQRKYADLQGRMAPYVQAGAGATGRMSDLLHLPPRATQAEFLRAPDGSVQQVPAEHVDHFLQLGAKRIQ